MSESGFYLSAAHKSSGKTIVACGICAALRQRGVAVQPFKKGPDYIDPLWLSRAAGVDCYNLDFHTQSKDQLRRYVDAARGPFLVEGSKGLHDGVSVDGSDSNAELAALLDIPVVLVLDTRGTTRGIAPLLIGYREFDPRVRFAGVILNKVAGSRHEQKLRGNVETHTGMTVLGAVPRDAALTIDERHIGLRPSNEMADADERIDAIAARIQSCIDLERLPGVSAVSAAPAHERDDEPAENYPPPDIRIGVARDAAFGFYYPDDLERFRKLGAELCFFDTLRDSGLPPELDGLFIGGGFPEIHMQQLSANPSMHESIRGFIRRGGSVYAECGGLMYLGRSLAWNGRAARMVGALPVESCMRDTPVGRGYMLLEQTGEAPWGAANGSEQPVPAHEFHYSSVRCTDKSARFAWRVRRGWGMDGAHDGLVQGKVLANYAHLRDADPVNWVRGFTDFVRAERPNTN